MVDSQTSSQGTISYFAKQNNCADTSLRTMVLGSKNKTVLVSPHKTKVVSFMVKTPEKIKGVVLGGISLQPMDDDTSNSMSIKNVLRYIMSVTLTKRSNLDTNDLDLQLRDISFKEKNHQQGYVFKIVNAKASIIENAEAKFYLKVNGKYMLQSKLDHFSMAPRSVGSIWISSQINQKTHLGKLVVNKNGRKVVLFGHVQQSSEHKRNKSTLKQQDTGGLVLLGSVGLVLLGGVCYYLKWR